MYPDSIRTFEPLQCRHNTVAEGQRKAKMAKKAEYGITAERARALRVKRMRILKIHFTCN